MSPTVLAIDDSQDVHKLLDVRLRYEGITLLHALDPHEGIRQARDLRPDLILLDIDMPEATGFEVCEMLKSDPSTTTIPIIFLTASSDVFDKVRGFDLGAVDYVTKPFDLPELRARVRAALRTKRYQDMLSARSEVDALTGLWNRGYFDKRLKDEIAATARYGRVVSLILFDVDRFKSHNDQHGHPFGDRVLEAVGDLLLRSSRATDAMCRYGGDEFTAILTETSTASAAKVGERIRGAVAELAFAVGGASIVVTASIGVAGTDLLVAPPSPEALIAAADRGLYAAKRSGRNCVRVDPDDDGSQRGRGEAHDDHE